MHVMFGYNTNSNECQIKTASVRIFMEQIQQTYKYLEITEQPHHVVVKLHDKPDPYSFDHNDNTFTYFQTYDPYTMCSK